MTRHRVLLIDDHDHVRFGLRRVLEGQGHAVEEADDGLDGVRKALAAATRNASSPPALMPTSSSRLTWKGFSTSCKVQPAL